ncbi:ParB/RepB/Spo0J family partition protein [Falsirhodobacter deserti]|uniref:ParB/RepB/Spo0J family partition protein n=1 Tax=Falsirhodobacter deserti TaxID=1365611 RepID=UPI001F4EC624|nr:ParB/RepB/Spo0J family partition protein [Falsirhodobacter deserti]
MADINVETPTESTSRRADMTLPVEKIIPNPNQPRREFAPEGLADLAASIRQKGVIQPLIVRPIDGTDTYEIVAGERRWRASQMAQLHDLPVVVRDFDDTEVLEVAIIENIQRADLNPIEEAMGFRQLMDRFGHTQEKLAEGLSKSRSHIANLLRLLNLPADVQEMLRDGPLSAGHARSLVTCEDASALARQVVEKGLSVRETEKLVKGTAERAAKPRLGKPSDKDADTRALEADLSAHLKMTVQIDHLAGGESGVLSIRYNTLEDLDNLCRVLSATRA